MDQLQISREDVEGFVHNEPQLLEVTNQLSSGSVETTLTVDSSRPEEHLNVKAWKSVTESVDDKIDRVSRSDSRRTQDRSRLFLRPYGPSLGTGPGSYPKTWGNERRQHYSTTNRYRTSSRRLTDRQDPAG